jgi:hypothetical protein
VQLLEDPQGTLDIEKVSRAPTDSGFVAATPDTANVGFLGLGLVGASHAAKRGRTSSVSSTCARTIRSSTR